MSLKILIIWILLTLVHLQSFGGREFVSGEKYCERIDFRNITVLRETFIKFKNTVKEGENDIDLLVCAGEVANLLWNIVSTKDEALDVSEHGYLWASEAKKKAPEQYDVLYLMAVNLLMYSYTRGMIESLKYLEEVRRLAQKVYENSPEFLDYSSAILLGALYAEAPWFPLSFGDIEKAEKKFLYAIKNVQNTTAYIFLARLYFRTNRAKAGAKMLERVFDVPAQKRLKTIADKDIDFWWHLDYIRALKALDAYHRGVSRVEIAEIIDRAPRELKSNYLPRALKNVREELK